MILEHNKGVYQEMCDILQENNSCCVVMGTGIGKTYVSLEYLKENNFKALVVSPRNSINDSWKQICGNLVDTITYSKLSNIYSKIDFSKYNLLICDEVHHIGAPHWGKPIKDILEKNTIKVLGLTESPIRYTDGERDVAQEYFDNNIAIGYDVSTAIEKGILNPVTYVGAMFNSDGLQKTLKGKIQNRLYAKLNLVLNNIPSVQEILLKNMPSGKRKGIIFASTIEDIKFAINFVKSIYPNITIKTMHSKQSDFINNSVMEWFKNIDEGYICSVDMISEGVHVKGVNTLIMLRRTESPNVFNQQLGRCLDSMSKEPAILFDLVNNKYTIRVIKNGLNIRVNKLFDINKLKISSSQQLIIKDYTKDIVEVLKEIKESLDNKYTAEELEKIKNFYNDNPSGYGLKKWAKINLPNHSYISVCSKSQALGLRNGNLLWFSEQDIEFIKNNYYKGAKYVAEKLNRNVDSVKAKAHKLGLKKNIIWNQEQIDIVKKYYPIEGKKVLDRLPNIGLENLRSFVFRNNIKFLGRKVICVETQTIYNSASVAQSAITGKPCKKTNKIIQCCEGQLETAFNYHWKYIN